MKKVLIFIFILTSLNCSYAVVHTFGIFSDAGQFNHEISYIMPSLKKYGVKNLIMPGDQVYEGSRPHSEIWRGWKKKFNFFAVAIGNHHQGYEAAINFFNLPGEFYSKTKENLRVIVLNSDNKNSVKKQISFLESELKSAKEKFIFVMFHHPPFDFTTYHTWKEREEFSKKVLPVLLKYKKKISALFLGHNHVASFLKVNGLPVFVAASIYQNKPVDYVDYHDDSRGIHVKSHWNYLMGRIWLRLKINTQTDHLLFEFINMDRDLIECTIRLKDGISIIEDDCWK